MTEPRNLGSRILVPLDGSAGARYALAPAVRFAQACHCPVELVTVYEPVTGRWAHDLDDVAEQLPCAQVDVAMVASGWPGEVIVELAAEQAGTLLCMTAMHRNEFDRLVLGSVSAHVLRTGGGPILFVGPGYEPSLVPERYHKLVVCVDGSPRDRAALGTATDSARAFGMEIELVHVAPVDRQRDAVEQLGADLARSAATLVAEGVQASSTVLRGDSPAEMIAELVASRPDALTLTAARGRTGLARLVLGSVTAELLNRSSGPVLVTSSL